jgi:glutamate--cysteine ligase catalytic subunit
LLLPHKNKNRNLHADTMGLLSLGTPLTWSEAKQHSDHVRAHGIQQLLATFKRVGERHGDHLLWGDEVRVY